MTKLSKGARAALVRLADGDTTGLRCTTIGTLVAAGLASVTHSEVSESYRPSPGWSSVRWRRTRIVRDVRITDAGRAFIATLA
jgi:hypothetical protein